MNRAEHVAWAKERAMEYALAGDTSNALASLNSDLSKHPETADHAAIELGMMLALSGNMRSQRDLVEFIDGVS